MDCSWYLTPIRDFFVPDNKKYGWHHKLIQSLPPYLLEVKKTLTHETQVLPLRSLCSNWGRRKGGLHGRGMTCTRLWRLSRIWLYGKEEAEKHGQVGWGRDKCNVLKEIRLSTSEVKESGGNEWPWVYWYGGGNWKSKNWKYLELIPETSIAQIAPFMLVLGGREGSWIKQLWNMLD